MITSATTMPFECVARLPLGRLLLLGMDVGAMPHGGMVGVGPRYTVPSVPTGVLVANAP
jgi:hypothetical protein